MGGQRLDILLFGSLSVFKNKEKKNIMQKVTLNITSKPTHLPKLVTDTQSQRLGSYFLKGTTRIYNPLTDDEEKNILIPFLGLDDTDKQLRLKIENYWKSFTISVSNGGLDLEIALDDKGPINITDWLKYRYAQGHYKVAKNEKESKISTDYSFYLTDQYEEINRKQDEIVIKTRANLAYNELLTDKKSQLNAVVRQLTAMNPDIMNDNAKKVALYNIVETDPIKFLKALNDPKTPLLGMIRELVQYNIIRQVANAYYYESNPSPLAENDDEMILFIQSKQNSGTVNQMRSKLQEAKKSVPTPRSEKVEKLDSLKKELELEVN